jgi:hypothetical protein
MEETKLTVRVPSALLENVKRYARQHNTTLTSLIGEYLKRIPVQAAFGNTATGCFGGCLSPAPG